MSPARLLSSSNSILVYELFGLQVSDENSIIYQYEPTYLFHEKTERKMILKYGSAVNMGINESLISHKSTMGLRFLPFDY